VLCWTSVVRQETEAIETIELTPIADRCVCFFGGAAFVALGIGCLVGSASSIGHDGEQGIAYELLSLAFLGVGAVCLWLGRRVAVIVSDEGVVVVAGRRRPLYPMGSVIDFAVAPRSVSRRGRLVLRLVDDEPVLCGSAFESMPDARADHLNQALARHRW
jgi:hypothetical protein